MENFRAQNSVTSYSHKQQL